MSESIVRALKESEEKMLKDTEAHETCGQAMRCKSKLL